MNECDSLREIELAFINLFKGTHATSKFHLADGLDVKSAGHMHLPQQTLSPSAIFLKLNIM
jgi:hypothetical protein